MVQELEPNCRKAGTRSPRWKPCLSPSLDSCDLVERRLNIELSLVEVENIAARPQASRSEFLISKLEVDASGFATREVILQLGNNNLWHFIAFLLALMNKAESNYKIWNYKMLAICEALKNWCYYLKELSELFEIWTDHCNFKFWFTMQHLTWWQAQWVLLLANYNFKLVHQW